MEPEQNTGHIPAVQFLQDIRLIVDTIPTLVWSAHPDGSADFFNQEWLKYTGLTLEQAIDWGLTLYLQASKLPDSVTIISLERYRTKKLKVYKGAPHGMCTTHKNAVNEDLLAFIKT